jgi:hypothetical protein
MSRSRSSMKRPQRSTDGRARTVDVTRTGPATEALVPAAGAFLCTVLNSG